MFYVSENSMFAFSFEEMAEQSNLIQANIIKGVSSWNLNYNMWNL